MAIRRRAAADRPEPLCRLVRFDATDGVELPGLLYEPASPTKSAVVWLHGTGGASVFDSKRTNLLAAQFVSRGLAFLPFNNRGAHVLKRLRVRRGVKTWMVATPTLDPGVVGVPLIDADGMGRTYALIHQTSMYLAGISPTPLHHEEVLEAGAAAAPRLRSLLAGIAAAL